MNLKWIFKKHLIVSGFVFFSIFYGHGSEIFKEKIYIHCDKINYVTGEDMWFKVYLVNADTHKQDNLSKIVYVDLIDRSHKIFDSKIIKIENGYGEGDFHLPKGLFSGVYTIRAYTNYMRNFDANYFFRRKIQINSNVFNPLIKESMVSGNIRENGKSNEVPLSKPDLQFFPEGGYLVENFVNRVGFKAIGIDGKGIDISGVIIDETGKRVKGFTTSKFGMGDFSFVPIFGKRYQAKIIYNKHEIYYDLPSAQSTGVLMHVVEYQDNYRINLQSSLREGTKNLEVLGRKNGEIICQAIISEDKVKTMVQISKSTLDPGIVQFTVLNNKGNPLCERLVFVEKEKDETQLNIVSFKKEYSKRDLVVLDIEMINSKEKTNTANMSISVTDVTYAQNDSLGLDIRSHLFLNSELRGEIEYPGYYFHSKDSRRKGNLDLLMLTQGWRQFIWNENISDNLKTNSYPLEKGFRFSGKVRKYINQKQAAIADVSLIIRNNELFEMDEIQSDAQGRFEFGDYDITDSTSIMIQAKNPKAKAKAKKVNSKKTLENPKMNYFIEMDTLTPPEVKVKYSLVANEYSSQQEKHVKNPIPSKYIGPTLDESTDRVKLDEVELKAEVEGLEKYDTYVKNKQLYRNPSQRVDFSELGKLTTGNVTQNLEGRIAGLSTKYVVEMGPRKITGYVSYFNRTQGLPLYLLNGIPADVTAINLIPLIEILFVDALRGTRAAIYGSAGAHGVIAVYTKDGSEIKKIYNKARKGIVNFVHPGYSRVRKFYEPVYRSKEVNNEIIDHRTTIYWNPTLKLNEQGQTKISFYSADMSTTYRVVLEGITTDGKPIVEETFIDIE